MGWFIALGILSLVFGLLFIFSKEVLAAILLVFERPMASIEQKVSSIRMMAGVVLLLAGGWTIFAALSYPGLWYLYIVGAIIILIGLLYLFVPRWLDKLSELSNRIIFTTDEIIIGGRRSVGIVLIILSVYFFYTAFWVLR